MNYYIDAVLELLSESCILERYYPLIKFKEEVVSKLKSNGIFTKEIALQLSDDFYLTIFSDSNLIRLFKKFLVMYDVNENKFKEIEKMKIEESIKESYRELYLLPGVKEVRANLYYKCGIKSLDDIYSKNYDEIIKILRNGIKKNNLASKLPLPKEINTHIVVAKLYVIYKV